MTSRLGFTALLHHVDVIALERVFRRLKRSASAGVDRETAFKGPASPIYDDGTATTVSLELTL